MGYLKYVLIATLLAGCGYGSNLPYGLTDPPPPQPPKEQQKDLSGEIDFPNFSSIDLGMIHESFILMFATQGCIPCNEEIADLRAHFAAGLPKNIRLISVLAGASMDRAVKWKQKMQVPWEVAIDPDDVIFLDRCAPEHTTPCVFTVNFTTHQTVTRHIGETPIEELEKETGPWTY